MSATELSRRSRKISPSQTLSISALSGKLRAEGKDVINLAVGQPDFPTPEHIREAGIEAIRQNQTRYTAVDGTPELKQAVVEKLARDNQLEYRPEQVLVSCGAKHTLYNLCLALLNKGDEVIVPGPFWTSYPEIVKLAEAEPIFINAELEQNFKITPQQLESRITDNTRLLMLNSPNNPSGAVYSKQELAALAEVLLRHPNIAICTDDIYEYFVYDGKSFSNIINACPELYPRTIIVNGVSKAFSMTGWRIGYAAGPEKLIAAMKKMQSHSTSNPCSISQVAAVAALQGSLDCVNEMIDAFAERRHRLNDAVGAMGGIECRAPEGSFYLFADFSQAIARHPRVGNDLEFAEYLLSEFHVAAVPGIAFGIPNYMRFSFATSIEELDKATARIQQALGAAA